MAEGQGWVFFGFGFFFKLHFPSPHGVDTCLPFLQVCFLLSFHTGQLVVPLVQLNSAGARTFVYAVHKLGNAILIADRSAASLDTFKSTLKTSLFTKLYSWDAQITHG